MVKFMGKLKENMIVSESQNSEIDDYLCCLDSDEMPKTEETVNYPALISDEI